MLSRKKRDAKFLIFQSLYLIAISILFYKGTDLSLNKVHDVMPGTITIDSNSKVYDPNKEIILPIISDSIYQPVSPEDTIVSIQFLKNKDLEIAELKQKVNKIPPTIRPTTVPDDKPKDPPTKIKGGKPK